MRHEHPTSRTDEWFTPRALLEALGSFDLDPCISYRQPWPTARRSLTVRDDGLTANWRGRVWLNPPYGRATADWLSKLADHNNGIALVFARTETQSFFDTVWGRASAILFLRGRIKFYCYREGRLVRADRAIAPSVLIAYGPSNAKTLCDSGLDGFFIDLHPAKTWPGWKAIVMAVLRKASTPLELQEIYRAVKDSIYRPTNRNITAKIRQMLYLHDDFRRVGARWTL